MRATVRLLGVLLVAVLAGCVSFNWSRDRMFRPLAPGALDGLEPGRTELATCLERLGAPLYVWEYKRDGAALAWGAADEDSKRIGITVPVQRARPSFSYGDVDAELRGAVLLFGDDFVLEEVREGCLRDLRDKLARARPAAVEPE